MTANQNAEAPENPWLPIDQAPRDGTPFELKSFSRTVVVHYEPHPKDKVCLWKFKEDDGSDNWYISAKGFQFRHIQPEPKGVE